MESKSVIWQNNCQCSVSSKSLWTSLKSSVNLRIYVRTVVSNEFGRSAPLFGLIVLYIASCHWGTVAICNYVWHLGNAAAKILVRKVGPYLSEKMLLMVL